jgi:hypothetical protein
MPFTSLAATAQAALTQLSLAVSTVHPLETKTFSFKTGSLKLGEEPRGLLDEVGAWAKGSSNFIYVFETDDNQENLAVLHAAVTVAKGDKVGDRCYPRLFTACRTLYVGGSQSLRSRFREHLGYASKTIYAMQLAYWASKFDVPVRFTAAKYPADANASVMGALEDHLWSQLKPMMGRQGRK